MASFGDAWKVGSGLIGIRISPVVLNLRAPCRRLISRKAAGSEITSAIYRLWSVGGVPSIVSACGSSKGDKVRGQRARKLRTCCDCQANNDLPTNMIDLKKD